MISAFKQFLNPTVHFTRQTLKEVRKGLARNTPDPDLSAQGRKVNSSNELLLLQSWLIHWISFWYNFAFEQNPDSELQIIMASHNGFELSVFFIAKNRMG